MPASPVEATAGGYRWGRDSAAGRRGHRCTPTQLEPKWLRIFALLLALAACLLEPKGLCICAAVLLLLGVACCCCCCCCVWLFALSIKQQTNYMCCNPSSQTKTQRARRTLSRNGSRLAFRTSRRSGPGSRTPVYTHVYIAVCCIQYINNIIVYNIYIYIWYVHPSVRLCVPSFCLFGCFPYIL